MGVALDDAFVRAHASGFRIKLSSRSGDDLILDVSAAQIAPVLEAIDAYLGRASDGAASEAAANGVKSSSRRNGGAGR